MGTLLYIIAFIFLIGWAIGVFVFAVSGFIHVLLIIAIIAILFRLIKGKTI